MKMARTLLLATLALMLLVASGMAQQRLRMSTTTSTENSGLLKVLLPPFEKANNCRVDVVAVGTGAAIKLGETGDVDVVFVHARKLEDRFVAAGFGVNRRDVMYNDFIIIGPASDPARARGSGSSMVSCMASRTRAARRRRTRQRGKLPSSEHLRARRTSCSISR